MNQIKIPSLSKKSNTKLEGGKQFLMEKPFDTAGDKPTVICE